MQEFLELISAVDSKVFFKLDIAEICFFEKGEAQKMFKSNNNGVHRVELTPYLKKNLIDVYINSQKISAKAKIKKEEPNEK